MRFINVLLLNLEQIKSRLFKPYLPALKLSRALLAKFAFCVILRWNSIVVSGRQTTTICCFSRVEIQHRD